MALAKSLDMSRIGVAATYWRIVSVTTDRNSGSVSYALEGFISEDHARAGGNPFPGAYMTGTASLAQLGAASIYEVTANALYAHAKRSSAPVFCTQEMVDAGHYTADFLGKLVMPESAPNMLAGAKDC